MSQEFPKSINSENKQFGFGPKLENPHSLVMCSVRVLAPNIALHTLCSRGVRAHVAHTHPAIVILQVDGVPRPERGGNTANFTKSLTPSHLYQRCRFTGHGFPNKATACPHSPVPALCRVCPNRLQRPPHVNLLRLLPKGSEFRERTQGCVNLILQGCPKRGGRGGGGVSRFELIFEFWNCFELF